ncbi:MAG: hypothetical protein J3Q66DRAFT_365271 [Benniella sp.]|nr:MAG: hypothetical protein J3Q66DRAFT_365271 [Benniella sp.]
MHQKAAPISSGVRIDADIRGNAPIWFNCSGTTTNEECRSAEHEWRLSTDKILGCPSECTDFECASALALLVSTTTAAIQLCICIPTAEWHPTWLKDSPSLADNSTPTPCFV